MSRKRRKKKKSYKLILCILLFLGAVTGLMFLAAGDVFDIKVISVEGAVTVSSEEIIAQSGIKTGENIFRFKAADAQNAVKSLIRIKNASVVRIYPNRVKIVVLERSPFISIAYGGGYYVYDDEGIKLFECADMDSADGMLLSGLSDDSLLGGDSLVFSASANTATAYEIAFWQQSEGLNGYITEIYAAASGYYYAYTRNSNVIKFYSLNAFTDNYDFIKLFLCNETRHIMVEVVEDSEPVYKVIQIN